MAITVENIKKEYPRSITQNFINREFIMSKYKTTVIELNPNNGYRKAEAAWVKNPPKPKLLDPIVPKSHLDERSKIIRQYLFGNTPQKSIESVIGEDERSKVKDTKIYPFSAICSLDSYWDSQGFLTRGTGALIGSDLVLTCAHNVYDFLRSREVMDMRVFPGRQWEENPFGSTTVKKIFFPDEWKASRDWDADIALLQLADPIGEDTGSFGLVSDTDENVRKMQIHATGYSGDLDQTARSQYLTESGIYDLSKTSLFYQADTFRGNSGSEIEGDELTMI